MNFSLQGKHCSSQMANSLFLAVVISHFYSAVYVRIAKKRGKQKAAVAGASKMLRVMYWMLKEGKEYGAHHS